MEATLNDTKRPSSFAKIDVSPWVDRINAIKAQLEALIVAVGAGSDSVPAGVDAIRAAITEAANAHTQLMNNTRGVVDVTDFFNKWGEAQAGLDQWFRGITSKQAIKLSDGTVIEVPALESAAPRLHFARQGQDVVALVQKYLDGVIRRAQRREEKIEARLAMTVEAFGHPVLGRILQTILAIHRQEEELGAARPILIVRGAEYFADVFRRQRKLERFAEVIHGGVSSEEFIEFLEEAERRYAASTRPEAIDSPRKVRKGAA